MSSLPWIVERADLVGVERHGVARPVAVAVRRGAPHQHHQAEEGEEELRRRRHCCHLNRGGMEAVRQSSGDGERERRTRRVY